jgi:hypothetical protein
MNTSSFKPEALIVSSSASWTGMAFKREFLDQPYMTIKRKINRNNLFE